MMMLPGVELARKRRLYLRRGLDAPPPPPRSKASAAACDSFMDESAVVARRRLDEKLYSASVSTPSSSSANSFRWLTSSGDQEHAGYAEREERSVMKKKRPVTGTSSDSSAEVCAVCLDELLPGRCDYSHLKLPCSHKYHTLCVMPWISSHSTCPCCRKAVFS